MQCPRCAAENRQGRRFCAACGAPLSQRCPACDFANEPGEEFCGGCGRALHQPAGTPTALAPASYTPKHLVERILTSRSAMEGERKQVTVLFCDLVESSRLAEQLDPEVMHEIMDRVLRLMAEAVHRYEGTVNQFLGDGLMALFGAPAALEDHAVRGVEAALTIQETLTGFSSQLQRTRGAEIRLRVGLNTGPVVVGRIGDDLRMDYTAVGDTTNLAARVQALADPGTVLITESTYRHVQGYVRVESLGPVTVRGRSQPVNLFRINGRRRRRSRLEVRADRGLTPFVGRSRELGLLRECWAQARKGLGQVVAIVGDPGVGKSRLLLQFRESLKGEPVTWLEGSCSSWGRETPYLSLLEILRMNFEIDEGDNPLQVEEKLRRGVRRLAHPGVDEVVPFLRELFQLPGPDDAVRHLDAQTKRRRTFEAIRTLTAAGARARPLAIVVEDLHWIDQASEDFLSFFVPGVTNLALLLIVTHRLGYVTPWANRTACTQVALDTLAETDAEAMVTTVVGTREIPAAVMRRILEKAEGNPLSVEEITVSLLERGVLARDNSRIRWTGDVHIDVPATIQDVVRARIDRLDEPVKSTVQVAAVIGRQFGARLLARVADDPTEVDAHLATLRRAEVIREERVFPEVEFAFKHAVIQEVAYQSLLAPRRSRLHGAIGRAIAELYADQIDEQAVMLVHHYRLGEQHEEVFTYAMLAGDQAARVHAITEARAHYEHALEAARRLGPSPPAQRAEVDATLKLAAVGLTREHMERDHGNLQAARAVAGRLGDEARLARILYWLGRHEYVRWNPQAAIDLASQSLEIGERLQDDTIVAPPVNLLGRIYWIQSDYVRASQMLERSVEQMRRLGNKGEEATAAATAACVFGLMGEFDRALPYADAGIRLAKEIGNPFAEAAAYQGRGIVYDQRGEWTRALADYERARGLAEPAGDLFRVFVLKSYEGRARAVTGDVAAGRAQIEEGLAMAAQIGTRLILGWQKFFLATCRLAVGDAEAAVAASEEGIQSAAETGDRMPLALARRTLGEALVLRDPAARPAAEASIQEAIRTLKEIGAKPELARTYATYGRLLTRWQETEAAKRCLGEATAMFRAMGMAWDLEQPQ